MDRRRSGRETAAMAPPDIRGERIWRDLDAPRVPSEPEHRLLTTLAAAVDERLLHDQLSAVVVTAVCRCGCSSVRLRSEQQPIPAERVAELSGKGRDDYFAVAATGRGPTTTSVDVVLHVMKGRVGELEVFDVTGGEGVAVPLTGLTSLAEPTVG